MPLASQERVEGVSRFGRNRSQSVAIRSRFGRDSVAIGRDSVAIRSRFGRDSVAIRSRRCRRQGAKTAKRRDSVASVSKARRKDGKTSRFGRDSVASMPEARRKDGKKSRKSRLRFLISVAIRSRFGRVGVEGKAQRRQNVAKSRLRFLISVAIRSRFGRVNARGKAQNKKKPDHLIGKSGLLLLLCVTLLAFC